MTLDFEGLVRAYEAGSGKKLRVERLGSLEDLDAHIDQLKKAGPDNFLAYLPLMYYRSILNGEGKLDDLNSEKSYSSMRVHMNTVAGAATGLESRAQGLFERGLYRYRWHNCADFRGVQGRHGSSSIASP